MPTIHIRLILGTSHHDNHQKLEFKKILPQERAKGGGDNDSKTRQFNTYVNAVPDSLYLDSQQKSKDIKTFQCVPTCLRAKHTPSTHVTPSVSNDKQLAISFVLSPQ